MLELLKVTRRFGLPYMWRLRSSYQAVWNDMFRGYIATTGIHALLNVGLLDRLEKEGTVDIESFAETEDLDIDVLRPLCEAFYSMGIFDRDGDRYRLNSSQLNTVQAMKGWFEVSWGYAELFHSLEDLLRGEKEYGRDFYRRSDFVARGSGEMEQWLYFPMANDIILERGYKRVLDLGCGDGTFLRKLCALNSEVRCFGIDMAREAVEEGRCRASGAGLDNRICLYNLDISKIERVSGSLKNLDVATAFFVLHELLYFGEQVLIGFLKDFRRLFPEVPLIVFETIRPTSENMANRKGLAIYYFLYHDLSQQKPVDRETWKELFRSAGFRSIEERHLPFVRSAIYTLR